MNRYEKKLQVRLNYYKITKFSACDLINEYRNCAYCDEPLNENNYSVEHIVNPTSKDDFEHTAKIQNNIVLCCRTCNRSKGNKTLKEWFSSNSWYMSEKNKTKYGKSVIAQIKEHTLNSKNPKIKQTAKEIFKDN